MSKTMRITLRAGEIVYVNGAVLRVDRKTSIEFLNNVIFLLENHVMQPEQATTPLRKMYSTVQRLLMEPANGFSIRQEFYRIHAQLLGEFGHTPLADALSEVKALVNTGRVFEALKRIRQLYELEEKWMEETRTELEESGDSGNGCGARKEKETWT